MPDLNVQLVVIYKLALSAYIQLCNAVDLESGRFAEIYVKRLEMANRSMDVTQTFLAQTQTVKIMPTGIISAVRPSYFKYIANPHSQVVGYSISGFP